MDEPNVNQKDDANKANIESTRDDATAATTQQTAGAADTVTAAE